MKYWFKINAKKPPPFPLPFLLVFVFVSKFRKTIFQYFSFQVVGPEGIESASPRLCPDKGACAATLQGTEDNSTTRDSIMGPHLSSLQESPWPFDHFVIRNKVVQSLISSLPIILHFHINKKGFFSWDYLLYTKRTRKLVLFIWITFHPHSEYLDRIR